ncbi:MAG: ABC transporter ATP-binding protein [Pseudomonadota bacterium]
MLKLESLTVRYGNFTAVDGVSLEVGDSEIITLVGPTGCGKSSVLRSVAGFETPAAGEIQIGGRVITKSAPLPPERRNIGLVFQDFALFPHLNVADNIGFRVKDTALVEFWLDQLDLNALRDKRPETLSGGQKQRVALARALAHEPSMVLLDEPLSNLDAALKADLRWRIRDALKTAKVPALWVTHDQSEALAVGDRVGVMRAGRLEQIAEAEACYRAPLSRFVARFLGEGVLIPGRTADDTVDTEFGSAAYHHAGGRLPNGTPVDVLLRPHDLALQSASGGNARMLSSRYEGETRLCTIETPVGTAMKVRVDHEQRFDDGAPVTATISATHALPVFETHD